MVSYLALAYLKGDSAKAAKIIVFPEALESTFVLLNLNPFERISIVLKVTPPILLPFSS